MTLIRGFTTFFLLFSLTASAAEDKAPVFPETCQKDCVTKFAEILGTTKDGTISYSNCQPKCVYLKPSLLDGSFAGIEWQCVEFARRWLMKNKKMTFESIDVAADLWNKIDHLVRLDDKQPVPLVNFINGSDITPVPGDLLIYGREYLETGHVAIVIGVNKAKNEIQIAEQNYSNQKWMGKFSRSISYVQRKKRIWLLDPHLIGWKHIQ